MSDNAFNASAADLLADLRRQGVAVTARGDRLHLDGPSAALTDELLARIKAHKPTLLRLLEGEQSAVLFDNPTARWYPWLGLPVMTPDGPGRLAQASTGRLSVTLDGQAVTRGYLPADVRPL